MEMMRTHESRNEGDSESEQSARALVSPACSARTRSAAGVADALLAFFPALSIARELSLPRILDASVVSATTRAAFEPLTNYAQFALCAVVVWAAFVLGHRRGKPILQWAAEYLAQRGRLPALAWFLVAAALILYVVNVSSSAITGPLIDGFHEGEYLGFIPAMAGGMSVLTSTFTVHGPGVDLLPGFLTARFGDADHGIVLTRLVYATLRSLAVLVALLVVLALTKLVSPESGPAQWVATAAIAFMLFSTALQIGAWPDELPLHKTLNARDAVYLLQVFLVLSFAALQRRPRTRLPALALAAATGASLPWAVFYSYDRGLYGVGFILLASVAFVICGRQWARSCLAGLAAGIAIGVAGLYALVGPAGVDAVTEQIGFWIRYGRDIWAYAGIAATPNAWTGALVAGAFIALALGAARVVQAMATGGGLRAAFRQQIGVIIMCAASIPPLRMVIERGDAGHVAWGVAPGWILICVLAAGLAWETVRRASRAAEASNLAAPLFMVAISALVGLNLTFFNPVAALRRIDQQYYAGLQTSDRQLLSASQIATMDAMASDLRGQSCFFTLTNESAWYYLFGKESCSRFYQVTNARPIAAQHEVVAALQSRAPALVLFSTGGWSNLIDGVSVFNANAAVARHVLSHYVPDRVVADNWFWRRSDYPPRFSNRRVGATTGAPSEAVPAWDPLIAGEYAAEPRRLPPKALFVTVSDANTPIWAGRPNRDELEQDRWSATVPTAALPKGKHRIRVWAFHEKGTPMVQLGDDVELHIR
jgi:hypothetical protein